MRFVENDEELAEKRPSGTAQLLADAAGRWAQRPAGRFALILRLGSLVPPPVPHQRRIARALLHETAERTAGQVFPLANGDLVLLCRAAPAASSPLGLLAATLIRLFAVAAPDPARFLSCWSLAEGARPLLAYAAERLRDPGPAAPWADPPLVPRALLHPARALSHRKSSALLERETAVFIAPRRIGSPALRPLFHEIRFSASALAARPAFAGAADPDVLRGARRALEQSLLAALLAELPGVGTLGVKSAGLPLHLALAAPSVASPAFARLVALAAARGIRLAVALSFAEVFAEPGAFAAALALLRVASVGLVFRDISATALLLARPEALGADLLTLDWVEGLVEVPEPERRALATRLQTIGVDRIVLAKVGDERAVRWGLARGIHRFQGRHVAAMLTTVPPVREAAEPGRAAVAA